MSTADAGGAAPASPFASFWMAGFEGADHINADGHAHDPAVATGHLAQLDTDYAALARLGIRTVRESLGWRLTEGTKGFDFTRLRRMQAAADRHGVQIIWTLLHYGLPAGVDYFDERFVERYCAYADAAGRELRRISRAAPVWNPINEINFVSWAATESTYLAPHRGGRAAEAYALKRRLVRAALRAMDVLRALDGRARFLHVEPVVHIVADRPEDAARAARERAWQWQAWDLMSGRVEPELGGHPAALDLLGIVHYHSSQWEIASGERLAWHTRDARRLPLGMLMTETWQRYRRPLVIAETGHFGAGRAQWFDEVAAEVYRVRRRGVPVLGCTLYPAVDRPDWERPHEWHHAGLWDAPEVDGGRGRVLNVPYVQALRRWQTQLPAATDMRNAMKPTLIVFSHLRWNFVFQRPQHVMTRLAAHYRVLFVEEPVRGHATPYLERYTASRDVEVLRPRTAVDAGPYEDAQLAQVSALLAEYLEDFAIDEYAVWFYTPMALPLLDGLQPRAVVYDCMDELSAFRGAPPRMLEREAALLARADVVYTGGPSLYEAKRRRHANVHCLPSAVDAAHYAPERARTPDPAVERLLAEIPRPRLGFFGVIDERFDTALLAAAADARPDWQFVMVGPVVKIDCASLPRRPNIHWLGQQEYARLPHLVAAWDVCLLLFALNESTRFISPTKTLEYMAAAKPIVSTPVHDVASLYGDAVAVAGSVEAFVAACAAALAEDEAARTQRLAKMRAHVARTTWDGTVQAMVRELRRIDGLRTVPARRRRPLESVEVDLRAAGRAIEALVAPAARTSSAGS